MKTTHWILTAALAGAGLLAGPLASEGRAAFDDRNPPAGDNLPSQPPSGPPAPPAPPTVDRPDLALEVLGCQTDEAVAQLKQAIESSRSPKPQVITACPGGRNLKVGVWLSPPRAGQEPQFAAARDRGLADTDVLDKEGVGGAILITDKLVRRVEGEVERALVSTRLDGGKVRITSFALRLAGPDRVVGTVKGFKKVAKTERAHFTTTITDTLSLNRRAPVCRTSQKTDVDADLSVLLSRGPLGSIWYLVEAAAIELHYESVGAAAVPRQQGAGCALATNLLLPKIPLKNRKILDLNYESVEVTEAGIAGYFNVGFPRDREPSVRITGPTTVRISTRVKGNGLFKVRYSATPDDLLFFPATIERDLTMRWAAQGATVSTPSSLTTDLRIDLRTLEPGDSKSVALTIRVTDREGMVAQAVRRVTVIREPPDLRRPARSAS